MMKKKKILILAANPRDSERLRLGPEIRDIREGIERSTHGEQFIIHERHAVRAVDIQEAIQTHKPEIIHFCGHGDNRGLWVEDDIGNSVLLQPQPLSNLFGLYKDHIECVVLNTGRSHLQAAAISRHIGAVIGMNGDIRREAATEFAVGFYDALGAGKSYEEAFDFGKNAVSMHENNLSNWEIPVLYMRNNPDDPDIAQTKRIFICHNHKDKTLYAEPLARGLRYHGVDVWIDEGSIRPGDSLREKLHEGIAKCNYVIVLITPNSIKTKWVNLELNYAYEKYQDADIDIIPVVFGSCVVPEFLYGFPYVDFRSNFGYGLKDLLSVFRVPSKLLSRVDTKKIGLLKRICG